MKNKKTLLIGVLILLLVLGGAGALYAKLGGGMAPGVMEKDPAEESEEAPELTLAPDFTVVDEDGAAVRLSDFFGTPIVLNFWASWCGPCRSEMPDFDAVNDELDGEVQFLMINMTHGRETMESAKDFLEEADLDLPVYFDTEQDAAATYGINALPYTLFIDSEGYLVAEARSAINREILYQGIDLITETE